VYDGDGNRVKATVGGVTTAYVGNWYEWTGSTTTAKKYYYAGGQRIAMRTGSSTLNYLLGDHLGSTSITADSAGLKVAEIRYKAWGESRYATGTTPTTLQYTGQRHESTLGGPEGLYYYGARWYDPAVGRFVQADTRVSNPGNPQSLNRYSYVLNNSLKYTDPTGHREDPGCDTDRCDPDPGGSSSGGSINDPCGPGATSATCPDLIGNATRADAAHDPLTYILIVTGALKLGPTLYGLGEEALLYLGSRCVAYSAICRALLLPATKAIEEVEHAVGGGGGATSEEIAIVEKHLERFGYNPENAAMLQRLRAGYWTQWDQAFLQHELTEAKLMAQGMEYEVAHRLTLAQQGISYEPGYEAYLYHPEVIKAFSDYFSFAAQRLSELLGGGQ
jgi:RHS repeat-associated protein